MNTYSRINEILSDEIKKNILGFEADAINNLIVTVIEEFREKKEIDKQIIAKAAGVSPSYLSQVYSGDKHINLRMLAGICREFDLRFDLSFVDISQCAEQVECFEPCSPQRENVIEFWLHPSKQKYKFHIASDNDVMRAASWM
jgi:transcriptional regulator with XRE-family HTH domain